MKATIKYIAPWLAAAAVGGAIGLAPMASAASGAMPVPQATAAVTAAGTPAPFGTGADPLVPNTPGAHPYIPYPLGYNNHSDQDENYTTSGGLDLPF